MTAPRDQSWFGEVERETEFPPMCPAKFAQPLRADLLRTPTDGAELAEHRLCFEAMRLMYLTHFYFECELANGDYWTPPFRDAGNFPQFVLVTGGSGSGKTRSVWQSMRWLWWEVYGNDGMIYDRAVDLGNVIPAKAKANSEGDNSLDAWQWDRGNADLYFLDDLGQLPLQGRPLVELWNLIDRRSERDHGLTIITTNYKAGLTLGKKTDAEDEPRLKSMLRRIRERCVYIDFDAGKGWAMLHGETQEIVLPPPCDFAESELLSTTPPITKGGTE